MTYDILIQPHLGGTYQATVLNWPSLSAIGDSEQAALSAIQQTIQHTLGRGKIIQLEWPSFIPQISATTARRRVSRLVISEVGNLLYGGEPTLRLNPFPCWQVPILLAYPDSGLVGQVGLIEVDAATGKILITDKQLWELADHARQLAESTITPTT